MSRASARRLQAPSAWIAGRRKAELAMLLLMQDHQTDFETAARLLSRRLAEVTQLMEAAEPGTDDFLAAYERACRLRALYRQVRETWLVPPEVWRLVA